jgi:benzoate-CoA ligase family protein
MSELFNASTYLLDRHVAAGQGARLALTGSQGELTYAHLHDLVRRLATGFRRLGVQPEHRVMMFMADSPWFVAVFLAALRIGAVPVPVSTMMRADGLAELLRDSRARFLAITAEFGDTAAAAAATAPELTGMFAPGNVQVATAVPLYALDDIAASVPDDSVYPTVEDSPAFWLYTSGTTGRPKGAMHRHGSIPVVCETYGTKVLGIHSDDRCLSAAKGFFAYGLGNSVLMPLSVGAAAILEPAPSKPDTIADRAREYDATLFFAGPTFFANMLRGALPRGALPKVRLAVSAGEQLPVALYQQWTTHFGVDIIDGIGMTEMLHIFLSNRPGAVRPGTTGVAVPGYDLRIVDTNGHDVPAGHPGMLLVHGESTAVGYWSRYAASRQVFQGEWLRTGDTYLQDPEGYYTCLGRVDDVLKVSGMWVSPAEVENRLLAHPAVGQAVVVAAPDTDGLDKTIAFVILRAGHQAFEAELIEFCRQGIESFKCPRKLVFVEEFPTTATGKIRRVELRAQAEKLLRLAELPEAAAP